MEGFLFKKGRGESAVFGRKNWKKRWFILEGTYVTYYETFSLDKNQPVNKKGTAPVRGCKITVDTKSDKKHGFVMTHDTRKPLYMAAESEKLMKVWIKALEKAATGNVDPTTMNFDDFYDALGMERNSSYTQVELNKFHRKAALKNHPDKGGNADAFKAVQEAFEVLKSRLDEIEEAKLWTTMDFVATIEKGAAGVGFGMVVVENAKAQVIAKRVMEEKIMLLDIEQSSGGAINPGDQIVKIDSDDISAWTLMRVVQRLNDYRAPVGTAVRFTFRRRVRIGRNEEGEEEVPPRDIPGASSTFEEDERIYQEQFARQQREEEETRRRMAASYEDDDSAAGTETGGEKNCSQQYSDINDIDEDDFDTGGENDIDEGPSENDVSSHEHNETFTAINRSTVLVSDAEKDEAEDEEKERKLEELRAKENARKREEWAKKDPLEHIACLKSENDSLEEEMRKLRQELRDASDYKNRYLDAVLDLEEIREEAHMFLEQLEAAEDECQAASRREMAAMDVINQLSGAHNAGIPPDVSAQILKDVREAADLVQKGYDLTGEYGYSLEDSLHLSNDHSIEYAQKVAYSAAIMIDKSGVFSQKYDNESQNMDLIYRLENSLKDLMNPSRADDNGLGWFNSEPHEYPGRRSIDPSDGSNVSHRDPNQQQFNHYQTQNHTLPTEQSIPLAKPRRPPPPPRQEAADRVSGAHDLPDYGYDESSEYKQNFQPNIYDNVDAFDNYQPHFDNPVSYNRVQHADFYNKPVPQSSFRDYSNFDPQSYGGMGYQPSSQSSNSHSFTSPIKFGPRKKKSKPKAKSRF